LPPSPCCERSEDRAENPTDYWGSLARARGGVASGAPAGLSPSRRSCPRRCSPIGATILRSDAPYTRSSNSFTRAGVRRFYIGVGRGKRAIEDRLNPDSRFLDFLGKRS